MNELPLNMSLSPCPVVQLSEQQLLEVVSADRDSDWLVAFMPERCGRLCGALALEWRRVADKVTNIFNLYRLEIDPSCASRG